MNGRLSTWCSATSGGISRSKWKYVSMRLHESATDSFSRLLTLLPCIPSVDASGVTFSPRYRLSLPGGEMSFWKNLRYGFRLLRLSPGFSLAAIFTLGLGIGANAAIFQLIDAIRLRTIPVKHPEQLATVRIADRHWGSGQFSSRYSQLTFAIWEQIHLRQLGFDSIAVW